MRWVEREVSNVRVRSGFLLFPKRIGKEWRWLEYTAWRERYAGACDYWWWEPVEWLDEEVKS